MPPAAAGSEAAAIGDDMFDSLFDSPQEDPPVLPTPLFPFLDDVGPDLLVLVDPRIWKKLVLPRRDHYQWDLETSITDDSWWFLVSRTKQTRIREVSEVMKNQRATAMKT